MGALTTLVVAAVLSTLAPPTDVTVSVPANDDGAHLLIKWKPSPVAYATGYQVYRSMSAPGFSGNVTSPEVDRTFWRLVTTVDGNKRQFKDTVPVARRAYMYAVRSVVGDIKSDNFNVSPAVMVGPTRSVSSYFDTRRVFVLLFVMGLLALMVYFYQRAKRRPESIYVRRIPGIDAIEEAIGRATEMGRPVLYVPGVEELQNIQTIASVLILGNIAEMTARYDTELRVPCTYPLVMVVAEETVRQGYANAGRADAHKPQNISFISSEQFAFAAGTNGIILREKPAANIYLGAFLAESLIFAETGYVNKSIQIAGTAEITQLPFFIAACDYTLIGEELYAVSAYLSREPRLLSALKATDLLKAAVVILLLVGVLLSSLSGRNIIGNLVAPDDAGDQ